MMKVLGVLGGLFMLFRLTHVHANLMVACTTSWLLVRMERLPLVNNIQVQPQELTLGVDCPVSAVQPQFFVFHYVLSFCGMRIYEQQSGTFIETSITYNSPHLDFNLYLPITCLVLRKLPIRIIMKRGGGPGHEHTVAQEIWPESGGSVYPGINLGMSSWSSCPSVGYRNFTVSYYMEGFEL